MNKKVLITTFCTWTSNGSILQAYALKSFLKNECHVDSLIAYEKDYPTIFSNYDRRARGFSKRLRLFIKRFLNTNNYSQIVFKKNHDFMSKNIDFLFFDGVESFQKSPCLNDFDLLIAGSDQIFNPAVCDLNPLFYFDGLKNLERHKISYAASMGDITIPPQKADLFEKLLKNFDFISVREQDCVSIIKDKTGNEPSVHIDPTFLLDSNEWRALEKPYPLEGKYYLVFPLYWDSSKNKELKELEKKTKSKIIVISYNRTPAYGKKISDVGVAEFLWLIDHAEGIISSSFHGVALSLIFRKPISAVVNPNAPSRIESLLKTINVQTLSISELGTKAIDYSFIDQRIAEERRRSYDYLMNWIYEK